MSGAEIAQTIREVHEALLDEVPALENWRDEETRKCLEWAVTILNTCNPKSRQSHTLETAPSEWAACLAEGAAVHLLTAAAAVAREANPKLAHDCTVFAKNHEEEFYPWAKRVTAVRPFSR